MIATKGLDPYIYDLVIVWTCMYRPRTVFLEPRDPIVMKTEEQQRTYGAKCFSLLCHNHRGDNLGSGACSTCFLSVKYKKAVPVHSAFLAARKRNVDHILALFCFIFGVRCYCVDYISIQFLRYTKSRSDIMNYISMTELSSKSSTALKL